MALFAQIIAGLIVVAMALSTFRLVRGPGLANRVVALDVMALLGAALSAAFAVQYNQRVFLDLTLILALVSFVGTVAFAHHIERRVR